MCSNCSGDDLRPESFAAFDDSSPKGGHAFAAPSAGKRKHYGTSRILAALAETALTQAILHLWRSAQDPAIIRNFDRPGFVNLNSAADAGQSPRKTGVPPELRELVEIRVSSDAIIEVFASPEAAEYADDERKLCEGRHVSPWEERFAERSELQRALKGFRRARQLRYFVAYGALLSCAAMAIWYAFS
jgi:hypothetical protein